MNADSHRAIRILVNGLQGEVVVNGQRFNNSMPKFPLSDQDIASALTYVYNSFGNSGQEVTADEVAAVRAAPPTPNENSRSSRRLSKPRLNAGSLYSGGSMRAAEALVCAEIAASSAIVPGVPIGLEPRVERNQPTRAVANVKPAARANRAGCFSLHTVSVDLVGAGCGSSHGATTRKYFCGPVGVNVKGDGLPLVDHGPRAFVDSSSNP